MPTTRPRHMVTEVDDIAAALDDAAKHWPQYRDQRGKLLQFLIGEGHKAICKHHNLEVELRSAAIRQTAGILTDVGDEGGHDAVAYLRTLRDEWPL